MGTPRSSKINLLAWYACAACCRWYCKSIFFWAPIRMHLTCNPTIFVRPCLTEPSVWFHDQSWLSKAVDCELSKSQFCQHSTQDPLPTTRPPSYPTVLPTFNLNFRMANCNTAQKRRGLKTHPCRTPPVMLNFLLRPDDPMTSPNCPSYNFEIIQTMCSEMPCSCKLFRSAGQWTRSNAFDRSKLTTHTGIPTAKDFFPGKHLRSRGVLQCVCRDENRVALPARWSSSWCSILSRTRRANTW